MDSKSNVIDIRNYITRREDMDIRRGLKVAYTLLGDYIYDNGDTEWGSDKFYDERITLADDIFDDEIISSLNQGLGNDEDNIDEQFERNNALTTQICSFMAYYMSYDGYSEKRAEGLQRLDIKAFVNTLARTML